MVVASSKVIESFLGSEVLWYLLILYFLCFLGYIEAAQKLKMVFILNLDYFEPLVTRLLGYYLPMASKLAS